MLKIRRTTKGGGLKALERQAKEAHGLVFDVGVTSKTNKPVKVSVAGFEELRLQGSFNCNGLYPQRRVSVAGFEELRLQGARGPRRLVAECCFSCWV